ncbi:hypothetical protein [Klebsiella michiganensis]|uniref:hypothetical protein n=1 Tax=Klebsiella michiganensis TaxID=1134687 RepID=UPI00255AE90B|nr:hypothetical protein [Klebsiella michiganensis]MDL4447690.1 hypothetical protein [Klebsiella michiganensis]MDL4489510.1 hypothetical protein [Klebsiella michiganensis]MDL4658254.1 hypothetical protein [Klebsiella michiganensis]
MHAEEALTYPGSSPPNILINDQVVLSYRFPSATIAESFTDGDRDMKKVFLAIIGMSLVGCSQPKPPESDVMSTIDFSKADYGQPPTDYKLQIKSWLEQNLKDPDSAKVSEPTPLRKEVAIDNRQPIFGYTTCMGVNSKNSYGGYTGTQGYWFLFHNGKIVRAQNMETFPGRMIFRNHYVKCD